MQRMQHTVILVKSFASGFSHPRGSIMVHTRVKVRIPDGNFARLMDAIQFIENGFIASGRLVDWDFRREIIVFPHNLTSKPKVYKTNSTSHSKMVRFTITYKTCRLSMYLHKSNMHT